MKLLVGVKTKSVIRSGGRGRREKQAMRERECTFLGEGGGGGMKGIEGVQHYQALPLWLSALHVHIKIEG